MSFVALRKFKNDMRASAAVVFGVALVPTVALVGSAIDYARSLQERAKLQTAADATAMAMARALSPTQTSPAPVATTAQNLTDGQQSIYTLSQSTTGVGAAGSGSMSSADLQESAQRHFRAVHHANGGVSEPSVSAANASSAVGLSGILCAGP
jgi:Flp pilus assembly protein TadG